MFIATVHDLQRVLINLSASLNEDTTRVLLCGSEHSSSFWPYLGFLVWMILLNPFFKGLMNSFFHTVSTWVSDVFVAHPLLSFMADPQPPLIQL